jgi:hypothetical protein
MIHYSTSNHRSGEDAERAIQAWLKSLPCPMQRPYIWPGTIPDQDLKDMARALPGWEYDCAVIYYQSWDPELPDQVMGFNIMQDIYQARYWRRSQSGAPEHVIAVIPSKLWEIAHLAQFLARPAQEGVWNDQDQHPGNSH